MKWIAVLTLLAALVACGDVPDGATDPAGSGSTQETTGATPRPDADSPTGSPTAGTDPSGTPAPSPTLSAKPTEMHTIPVDPPSGGETVDLTGETLPQFVAVDDSITCLFTDYEDVGVRCDVLGAGWQVERPDTCHEAYGDSVTLRAEARLTCHGDTIFSPDVTHRLDTGDSATFAGLRCTVLAQTVGCRNGSGSGFTVSQDDYTLR